ncbi:aspartyl protease family protein [Polaribacter haliotis]|uniref:Aspartyl protease family protein n=1 Tax=Polaribacter haliotis TaxID=1888915 RepID=A0A7L8AI85_9FLAO|nr:aspartyl protease family protein [Polaribacter haliotis]QOD61677.1 aspartyl protease family protein [Polaribacter haliotis]
MKKRILFILILTILVSKNYGQNGFRFLNAIDKKERIKFRLINNLIIIPIEINGKELSFILDTGVNKTIIFNLSENDSIGLLNPKKIALRGLGAGKPVDALISKNNKLSLKRIVGFNETIYVILKDYFDLSSKMGTTIHGIIGYNLLKNFIIKINYRTKTLNFYNVENYTYKKCRKCEVLPLEFYRKKPFVNVKVQLDTIGEKLTDVKLLIDSGGSDALWLFEHTKENIITPKRYFNDILGEGLSGSIYGNRSRIPKLVIGNFKLQEPTVSFLDTVSTKNARKFKQRNGSIGGYVLKRFKVWLDYPNKQIMFKKNGSFTHGFNYNMSGLEVIYNGKQLVKEHSIKENQNNNISGNNTVSFVSSYSYRFKPSFKIRNVVKGSPAFKAGLNAEDILVKINGKPAHNYTLNNIINEFQERENKIIRITVDRKGVLLKFEFRLEKRV